MYVAFVFKSNVKLIYLFQTLSCDGMKYECYVIDSSGYIVLSMAIEEVGQFFGMVQPYVLQSFIDKKIFEHVEVFNYQALCPLSILKNAASNSWLLDAVRTYI